MAASSKPGNRQHLTLSDRIYIEQGLERQLRFKDIAAYIEKDATTVSKEIRRHRVEKTWDRKTALCIHRANCTKTGMCDSASSRYCGKKLCGKCTQRNCHIHCRDYQAAVCERLTRAPYVCNGCGLKSCRQNTKYYYRASLADAQYRELLSDSRKGINKTPIELDDMDRVVSPLLKQGQSLAHIYVSHGEELGCSRRTLYHYIDQGAFTARNLDLPRKVRYKPRKKRKPVEKAAPPYRNGRTYKDFLKHMEDNPESNVVEMDTVAGTTGGPVLLTMLFRSCGFMLIRLLERDTQDAVCKVFNALEKSMGTEKMLETFPVILTDNGPEFKNPTILETSLSGARRTRIFYCDPMASWQKGRLEKNHEFIRYILPKGRPFDKLSSADAVLLMNHINSIARASLNGRTPFELASLLLPPELLRSLGAIHIPHDQVLLKPRLIKIPTDGGRG
jgi:IS30 family transposase